MGTQSAELETVLKKPLTTALILMNLMAVIMSLLLIAQNKVILLSSLRSLKATRSYTVQNKEYEILVDGQRIEIRPSERKEIPTKSRSVVLKLIRSPDDVLILETPYLRVI